MEQSRWRYSVLGILLSIAASYQAGSLAYVAKAMQHPEQVPATPFALKRATRTIGTGPLFGDQILAMNGRPLTGVNQYTELVAHSHPGDKIHLVLSEPSGRAVEKDVVIGDLRGDYESVAGIALSLCLDVLIPVVSLGLGFAVVFIRPKDKNAWLLLGLLLGFSGLVSNSNWYSPWPDAAFAWDALRNATWGAWMMLFAISFPRRLPLDERKPWLKYLLLVPMVGVEAVYWGIVWIWTHDIAAAEPLRGIANAAYFGDLIVQMLGVGVFFAVLGAKSSTKGTADVRRRRGLVWAGTSLSLAPMFLVVLRALIWQTDIFAGVPWPVEVVALCMMTLFPVTLAYVIVVQRAMDLSAVVRQSVQYTLAKGGIKALRVVIIVVIVNMAVKASQATSLTSWMETASLGLFGVVMLRQRPVMQASAWVDKKFFREAYSAEELLRELAVEAGRYVEIDPLLDTVAQRISATLHIPDIVILLRDGAMFRTRYSTRAGEPMDIAAESRIVAALMEKDGPLNVYFDDPQPWIRALDAEALQTLDFMRSQLLLPVKGRGSQSGQLIGIVSLGPKKSEAPYSPTDTGLLESVTWQMGMAIENSRLASSLAEEAAHREVLNRELEIAREVQERLFPQKFPKMAGIDCFGYCRPARGVGGDYYDFVEQPDGKLGIAIGDVSGKGIAAALLMASLQASLRGQTMAGIHDLAGLMSNVNKLVYDASQSNRYATFFYGEFDPATGEFRYVNAGHNPPVVLHGDKVLRLDASGPVVGLLPGVSYSMDKCRLEPGDIFIGYTDGISEALNEKEEEWEEDRFIAAAREFAGGSAKEMIEGIFRRADAFTGSAKQYDDMTLLVLKLTV